VHFHSDNYWFSGSETTLLALLADAFRTDRDSASFTYRAWPEYEAGLRARLDPSVDARALRLPDPAEFKAALIGGRGRAAAWAVKGVSRLLPLRSACLAADVARLGRLFRSERPGLVHVNNGGFPGAISCNAATIAAHRAGLPVVYVVNNQALRYDGLARLAGWGKDRLVGRSVTRFVTGSHAAAAALGGVLGSGTTEIEVIPNTILAGCADEAAATTRRRLGLPAGGHVIVTGARLERRKGHAHLIDAVSRLPADIRQHVTLVFAGQGPERDDLERRIAGAGLGMTIRLVGNQANMWNLYNIADLVVLPSTGFEDFPIVVLEAMAAGRPVIGTRMAGIPEQVVDGETGSVVPPADAAALAAAIESLLHDPERRAAMGAAGRARFDANYAPAMVVGQYRALHRRLMEEHPTWA
jgi:glycosyltransferase involved in cell wall biosynthesis